VEKEINSCDRTEGDSDMGRGIENGELGWDLYVWGGGGEILCVVWLLIVTAFSGLYLT
jgi:hypothetical protein